MLADVHFELKLQHARHAELRTFFEMRLASMLLATRTLSETSILEVGFWHVLAGQASTPMARFDAKSLDVLNVFEIGSKTNGWGREFAIETLPLLAFVFSNFKFFAPPD